MDGGIIEVDGYRPVQEMMEEVLAEHGHSVSECGVISAEYLQEQSYRAETQRAEAMKEKLAAEKPAPEASICKTYHYVICSFYLLALFSSAHR